MAKRLPDVPFEEQLDLFLNEVNTMATNKPKHCNSIYESKSRFESNGAEQDDFYTDVDYHVGRQIFL